MHLGLEQPDAGYARTDPLTGFGDRSRLVADLEAAVEPEAAPSLLMILVLVGLDDYRRYFGLIDGQDLLVGLADRLDRAVAGTGSCYRARHDEFAVLFHSDLSRASAFLDTALEAVREPGKYISIAPATGAVLLPQEAPTATGALQVADERASSSHAERPLRERRATPRDEPRANPPLATRRSSSSRTA